MKKIILAVALSLVTTAAFAQLTSTGLTSTSGSTSTTTTQQTSTAQGTIDLLGGDTVAGLGTSDTVAELGGTDSQASNPVSSPMPAFGHTGNLRQPGSIRH